MIDVANRVYSNVEIYVHRTYPAVHCQNSATATSVTLPALYVKQLDMSETAIDLDPGDFEKDFAVDSNVEIQVYSNKSITEARNIINEACTAMRGMGYTRRYGAAEIQDGKVPNLYRMVARFRRIVGSLDELPKLI